MQVLSTPPRTPSPDEKQTSIHVSVIMKVNKEGVCQPEPFATNQSHHNSVVINSSIEDPPPTHTNADFHLNKSAFKYVKPEIPVQQPQPPREHFISRDKLCYLPNNPPVNFGYQLNARKLQDSRPYERDKKFSNYLSCVAQKYNYGLKPICEYNGLRTLPENLSHDDHIWNPLKTASDVRYKQNLENSLNRKRKASFPDVENINSQSIYPINTTGAFSAFKKPIPSDRGCLPLTRLDNQSSIMESESQFYYPTVRSAPSLYYPAPLSQNLQRFRFTDASPYAIPADKYHQVCKSADCQLPLLNCALKTASPVATISVPAGSTPICDTVGKRMEEAQRSESRSSRTCNPHPSYTSTKTVPIAPKPVLPKESPKTVILTGGTLIPVSAQNGSSSLIPLAANSQPLLVSSSSADSACQSFIILTPSVQKPQDTRKRIFECKYEKCGKNYFKSSHLKAHIRTHTGKSTFTS